MQYLSLGWCRAAEQHNIDKSFLLLWLLDVFSIGLKIKAAKSSLCRHLSKHFQGLQGYSWPLCMVTESKRTEGAYALSPEVQKAHRHLFRRITGAHIEPCAWQRVMDRNSWLLQQAWRIYAVHSHFELMVFCISFSLALIIEISNGFESSIAYGMCLCVHFPIGLNMTFAHWAFITC